MGHDGKTHLKVPIFARKFFGAPWLLNHRVDLHQELRRLATTEDGPGQPATLRTGVRVKAIVGGNFWRLLPLHSAQS
jgi:salicylate hydroxylase